MHSPTQETKAELIHFWCIRAAEGRSNSAAKSKISAFAVVRSLFSLSAYAVRSRRPADILVLAHPDRGAAALGDVPYVGKVAELLSRKRHLVHLQMQPLGRAPNVSVCPWLALRTLERLHSVIRPRLDRADLELAANLASRFKISEVSVRARIRRLNFELRQWHVMIDRHSPKTIVLVDGYSSNAALIWMARMMGVKTVEVQHGACGTSHVGYNIIGNSDEALWPDYFLAWNAYWRDRMQEVAGYRARIKICRATAQSLAAVSSGPELPGSILLIHQPTLSQHAFDLLSKLPDRIGRSRIAVKYHPGMQTEWEARFDTLCDQKGVSVVRNRRLDEAVAEFGMIVGWFSTVLHQAADAGYAVRYLPQEDFQPQQAHLAQRGIPALTEAEFLKIGSA